MFVIQGKIEDQPSVVEEIDKQVQDAANVAFQEGLLPEEETAEEQWHLKDSVMSAFNTIFQGYKTINLGLMDLSKLIDGTPLNAMGQILNDIQESVARLAGYGEGEQGVEDNGEAEEVSEVGRGRKKGREGQKEKRPMMMVMIMGPEKIQKENLHPKKEGLAMYKRTALYMYLLAHHMT